MLTTTLTSASDHPTRSRLVLVSVIVLCSMLLFAAYHVTELFATERLLDHGPHPQQATTPPVETLH